MLTRQRIGLEVIEAKTPREAEGLVVLVDHANLRRPRSTDITVIDLGSESLLGRTRLQGKSQKDFNIPRLGGDLRPLVHAVLSCERLR